MKVRCIAKSDPFMLKENKIYEVLSISKCSGWYRVIDETDEDYLYPPTMFSIVEKNPTPNSEY